MKHLTIVLLLCSLLTACNAPLTPPPSSPPAVAEGSDGASTNPTDTPFPAQTDSDTPTATFSGIATATFSGIASATPNTTPTADLTAVAEAASIPEAAGDGVTFTPAPNRRATFTPTPTEFLTPKPTVDLTAAAEGDFVPEATAPLVRTTLENATTDALCGWYVAGWYDIESRGVGMGENRLPEPVPVGGSYAHTFYEMSAYFSGWNRIETCDGEVVQWGYIESFRLGGMELRVAEPYAWLTFVNTMQAQEVCGVYVESTDPNADPYLNPSPNLLPTAEPLPANAEARIGMPPGEWALSVLFCGNESPVGGVTVTIDGDLTVTSGEFGVGR